MRNLWGYGEPRKQLAKTCETLQKQLAIPQARDKAWKTYGKALTLARQCGCEELLQVILRFDPLFGEEETSSSLSVGQALSVLLEAKPQAAQNLDAAWRLSQRLHKPSSIREVQQEICIQLARIGDTNMLLAKLLKRRNERTLTTAELCEILNNFLSKHSFQLADPWKAFLGQFETAELPQIHQVYAVVERYVEAAELAETARDYHRAIHYLMSLSGKEIAQRTLALSNRLGDENLIAQAHEKVAQSFWEEKDYCIALEHFQKAGNLERTSDCHQRLGELGLAIQLRPSITPEWMQDLRGTIENMVRLHIERKEFLLAARLLKTVEEAWRKKTQDSVIISEVDRTQRLLSEAVRTARTSFAALLQASDAQSRTEIFTRWSLLEEAAGNYLEAGLQAEKAQDYFAASLLFEKAGAFGQALVALESVSENALDPKKKALLLEQGGDFFMAGLLYERLGETEQAIAAYDRAKEFLRAAELRRLYIGDDQAVFDERFKELLTNAGRIEQLAELCATKAYEAGRSPEEKARFLRRIKELGDLGLVGQRWLSIVATELPSIEALDRRSFEEQAIVWVQTATTKVLADYTDAFGLDLGTSNSVVCLYNKKRGEPEVVEWYGRRQIPSVFAIDQMGREIVGVPISEMLGKSPRAIVTKAKREMGTDRKFRAGGQDYRPEEISARVINCARQLALEYLRKKIGETISSMAARSMGNSPPEDWVREYLERHPPSISLENAVITVPAYFNDAQKQATRTAGVLAGINILRLIHEPTAACLAQRIRETKNETILVADLGAGTFDLSIVEVGDGIFEVLEIQGDNTLGSADLDEIVYVHFVEFIKTETGEDITGDRQAVTRLRQACEEMKIQLSSGGSWTIELPQLVNASTTQLTLTREELERLASPWLDRVRATCQKISHKPSRILLIGGGAMMPAVHRCIRETFGLKPGSDLDPLTAVARGAAMQAALLTGDMQGILLLDAVPFSLGIKSYVAPGQFKFDSLIPKHKTIPTGETKRYTTIEDNQTQVRIEVFQGESQVADDNFKIGQFILQGIPLAKAGVPQIDVTFDIDANCLLSVTARDIGTGNQCGITIADSHLLTPAQAASLQARFRDSQTYQANLARLEKLAAELRATLHSAGKTNILELSTRFRERLQYYEGSRESYLPTLADNNVLFEVYRNRDELEMKVRLALDRWSSLSRSTHTWLESYGALDWRLAEAENQVQQLLDEGDPVLRRTKEAVAEVTDVAVIYRRWLSVIENLPINPEGNAEELARHFKSVKRFSEAVTHFYRIDAPLSSLQVELGLEILARSRQRDAYTALLLEHAEMLGVHSPDFENLNHSVRIYSSSVVWIQVNLGGIAASGSGFVISPNQVATNRHVLINEATGKCVLPEAVYVITKEGSLQVAAIHLPSWGEDDVAILCLLPRTPLTPLRLGFSELVEVGERIITIGFPAPDSSGFEENLYCNTGLVNRIRQDQLCTERVLEISIQLQGGISGAPILNQLGEVVGLTTFFRLKQQQELAGGQIRIEQSFYAITVELLRRLRTEIQD
ncbi:MAG: Hsp70 family protein [Stigonema ocellatum SAG 48.90 = DSM 106950]|nr:Hsp70 family protein [Stigonema ocellatum SAG 48.90 = DSM 106950]